MCERCGWRQLVATVKAVRDDGYPGIEERQRAWIDAIGVTVDDDRHCTDHQKAVVRRILRECGVASWRSIPKATDKSEWSDERRKRHIERKKMSRRLRAHGGF